VTTRDSGPILVLGATGKTGPRVAERLVKRSIPVRPGSRGAEPAFDWDQPATWPAALNGVRAVYIADQPDLAVPGAVETVGAFARLAADSGASRLVLLAGRGEPEAEDAERAVQAAGVDTTIVRASWFAQNFSESFLLDSVRAGVVALPANSVPEPFVDVDDIADAAVAALTEDGHAGELYEVTGPRLLTFADAVGEIGRATGRDVRFVRVSLEDYAAELASHEVPQDEIELLTYLFTEVLDGRNARLTDGIERAIGRSPRDFRQFARDAAASGVWNGTA
jgi:uncharacterized protein YbjT (DUF2867 family)